jgi:hypothetical protein
MRSRMQRIITTRPKIQEATSRGVGVCHSWSETAGWLNMKMLAAKPDRENRPRLTKLDYCLTPGRNHVLRKHEALTMKLKS